MKPRQIRKQSFFAPIGFVDFSKKSELKMVQCTTPDRPEMR